MRELILSSGPDRYFGGTIETFALPYGAFIVIACVLYYIFRHPHTVPRMKYLTPAHQTSVGTREPGTTGLTRFGGRAPASAPAADATAPAADATAPAAEADADATADVMAPAEDPAEHPAEDPVAEDQQEGDA